MIAITSRVDRSKELSFHIAEFSLDILQRFEHGKMHTLVDFDFDTEPSKCIAVIHLTVEVSYDMTFTALAHNCVYEFLIGDMALALEADGLMKKDLVAELVRESYALSRGMIAVRALGFGVADFPLPFLVHERVLEQVEANLAEKRAAVQEGRT
jgi:hypothetical protein